MTTTTVPSPLVLIINDKFGNRLLSAAKGAGGIGIILLVPNVAHSLYLNREDAGKLLEFLRAEAAEDVRPMPFGWGNHQHCNWIAETTESTVLLTLYRSKGEIHRQLVAVNEGNPGGVLLRLLREL